MQMRDDGGSAFRRLVALVLCAWTLLGLPCTVHAAETVRLQLKWKHQFQFAGYYAAIEQGYYREAGLDVRLIEAEETTDPVAEVVEGRADYGIGMSELLLAHSRGAPIVALAAIFQHSPLVLLVRRDRPGESLHDLIGRRVMMEAQSAELLAYLKRENVPLDRLEIVPHAVDLTAIGDGSVKAMSAYSTDEPFGLRAAGVPYSTFSPRAAGIDFYGDTLFTSESLVRRRPAQVKAMIEATRRGWLYAFAHVDETIDLILSRYSTRHSRAHLLFEAQETRRLVLPHIVEIGYMHPGRWRHIADIYAEVGMIPPDADLTGFLFEDTPAAYPRWIFAAMLGGFLLAGGAVLIALRFRRLNVALSAEVAEREAAQHAAEEANRTKSAFLASMSHELRTPLNAILGFSEMIEMAMFGPVSNRYRAYAGDIHRSGRHLLAIINDLLDLSKVEAGRMDLDLAPVDVAALMEDCRELLDPLAQRQLQRLTLVAHARPTVMADALRLRQIVMNLVSNALKFTPEGGSVTMSVDRKRAGDIELVVTDSGVGMTSAEVEIALQPFRHVGVAGVGGQGTGLGLPLAAEMTALHGGTLTVESAPGRGTTVRVVLPGAEVNRPLAATG